MASLTLNVPAVCFTVEKTCPVPVVSLTRQPEESSVTAPSSVSFVPLEEPDLEQSSDESESSVEGDPVNESDTKDLSKCSPEPVKTPTVVPLDEDLFQDSIQSEPDLPHSAVATAGDAINHDSTLRRSTRQRAPPKRLGYNTRGNPLISVVQTSLHSVSDILGVSTYPNFIVPSIQVL